MAATILYWWHPVLWWATEGTAVVLESVSPDAVSLSGQDSRSPLRTDLDPKSDQGRGQASEDPQEHHAPCDASFLCDRTLGSRSRHLDDQSAVGTRQLRDDHDLLARPPAAPGIENQSTGLAAGPTTARLAASQEGQQQRKLSGIKSHRIGTTGAVLAICNISNTCLSKYPSNRIRKGK